MSCWYHLVILISTSLVLVLLEVVLLIFFRESQVELRQQIDSLAEGKIIIKIILKKSTIYFSKVKPKLG